MNILEFTAVTAGYGSKTVIRDVDLSIGDGEIVALIGRNGVGKTTLMKTAMGQISPMAGKITFKTNDVTRLPANQRAEQGIGYVPQKRNVFEDMTVEENLKIGKQINAGSTETYFDQIYNYFPRLKERKNQRAGSMSGGERQMLAIGRALVGGPDILLLDEPSEGVQPNIIDEISENIIDINKDMGVSVLLVEQNLNFTTKTTERSYIMNNGKIVEEVNSDGLQESDAVQKYMTV